MTPTPETDLRLVWTPLALWLVGCVASERTIVREPSALGVDTLQATVERGDVSVTGGEGRAFHIEITSRARGGSRAAACENRAGNSWSVGRDGEVLVLEGTSESQRGSVDFDVEGPDVLDTDIVAERGSVHLEAVEGLHLVTASRVTSRQLIGDVDLLAESGGMDVEIWPYVDGFVYVESRSGDVTLRLPYGGAYDVVVVGDPDYEMIITDLGFHADFVDLAYFSGVVGDGAIEVRVHVTGGSFELLESVL